MGRPLARDGAAASWSRRTPASKLVSMPVITPEATGAGVGSVSEDAADPAPTAYGHAAAMLAAAQALEAATHPSGSVAATPATLVCLETSLDALSTAVARLRAHAVERLADPVLSHDEARP